MSQEKILGREMILSIGKGINPNFNLDDPTRFEVYRKIYHRFVQNLLSDYCESKRQRGILLIGPKGVGKSICMKVFAKLSKDTNRRFKTVTALKLKDLVVDKAPLLEIKEEYGDGCMSDLYIDDLGVGASDQNAFGNVVNIISELIFDRANLFVNERRLTHFSTNLATKQPGNDNTIEKLYGDRSWDRIKEMCDVIVWPGESLRKLDV
jgi:DNA replication protein DnaC